MDNWEMGRAAEIGGIFGNEKREGVGRVWNKQGRLEESLGRGLGLLFLDEQIHEFSHSYPLFEVDIRTVDGSSRLVLVLIDK